MTTLVPPGDRGVRAEFAKRPPMPSIAASALLESRMLVARTRRAVLAWLNRSDGTA